MVRPSPDPKISVYNVMGYYLRFLRMKNGVTQREVARLLNCSESQVSKYEGAMKNLDGRQCETLDKAWDTGGLFAILLYYAKLGIDANWPDRLRRYQTEAVILRIFSDNIVPMPFQTEDYARALLGAGYAAGLVEDVEGAVARRMAFQDQMLNGDPHVWLVLDEIGLRDMEPPEVMKAQRHRLLELGRLTHVSVRVLPRSAAPHIGMDGPFSCFDLPNGRRAAFSGTALDVGRVIDDQTEAAGVALRFERIAAQAWNETQSAEYIARMDER